MSDNNLVIDLKGVSKRYRRVEALKGVDLKVVGNVRAKAWGIGKTVPVDYVREVPWKDLQ